MALIGFRNTHNQAVYVNPDQVLYVTTFEEDVTIIALAVLGSGGKPHSIYVRGHVDFVQHRLGGGAPRPQQASAEGQQTAMVPAARQG